MRASVSHSLLVSLLLTACGGGEASPTRVERAAEPEQASASEPEVGKRAPEQPKMEKVEPERAAKSDPRPSREQRRAAARLLARGRAAARDRDWSTALDHFTRGLAMDPRHAKLYCEAGWAAFQQHDARAPKLLREGRVLARDPRVAGACLYNLGRYYEREGEREDAVMAYGDSLVLRPDNELTRARYLALTNSEQPVEDCPPAGPFADVEAFCAALSERHADEHSHGCETLHDKIPHEGVPLGEPVLVSVEHEGPYWTIYLLLRRADQLEVLGRVGTHVGRSCATGSVEVARLRWLPDARLVVELHREGEYTCNPTPYEECIYAAEEKGESTDSCEGVSDEWKPELVDDHPRMLCALGGARPRCSAPPEYYSEPLDLASLPPKLPEGEAFTALLVCPPGR